MREGREVGRALDQGSRGRATGTGKGLDENGEDGEKGEDAKTSSRPDALVLFNPVYDNGPTGYGHDRVKERWREISPMHNIDKDTPPTIVFLGTKDKLIPVKTAQKYKELMEDQGVRSDLHVYEGQPHGFFNHRGGKNPCYHLTVIEADRFLAALGFLEGEPTLEVPAEKAR
ncbi:MAG: alpha/beta hydrolase [Planctomycetota bacterium]|jgi:acetyl esterase/lipase